MTAVFALFTDSSVAASAGKEFYWWQTSYPAALVRC